jgi:hypothetical protein
MHPYPLQAAGGAAKVVALAHSDCSLAQDKLVVAAGWVAARRAAVVGWVAVADRDGQANTAPEDFVDPGRIAIHNRVVAVVPVFPAGAGAVAVLRFPNSRSVIRMSLVRQSSIS